MQSKIVVFNYNYSLYINRLFDSFIDNQVINNKNFEVIFCDDGSDDSSLDIVRTYQSSMSNVTIVNNRDKFSGKRKYPSFGQLSSLEKVLKTREFSQDDVFFLVDCDDYYPTDYFKNTLLMYETERYDLILSKVKNVSVEGDILGEKKISRKVRKNQSIWPSITCTSGISVTAEFLLRHSNSLFDYSVEYSDVWLDARLGYIGTDKLLYSSQWFYRVIHGENDSKRMSLSRRLHKQLQAARYFHKVSERVNFRVRVLRILDLILNRLVK